MSIFPSPSSPGYAHFEQVARTYAADIGVSAEMLARGEWREKVTAALAQHFGPATSHTTVEDLFGPSASHDLELAAAYLAGAYSGHGTPLGFRLVNQRKGLYLAWLTRLVFVDLTIDATLKPGIPGNITIALRDGGRQTVQGFVDEMERIRTALGVRK